MAGRADVLLAKDVREEQLLLQEALAQVEADRAAGAR